jgi:hypothetical protein
VKAAGMSRCPQQQPRGRWPRSALWCCPLLLLGP